MFGTHQNDLLRKAFREAIHLESRRRNQYARLAGKAGDNRIKSMFGTFERTCRDHIMKLREEMKNF